jgi:tetratricopeptide (TPR) repeat protein
MAAPAVADVPSDPDQRVPRELYEAALRERDAGRVDVAVRLLERAIAAAPDESTYYLALADVRFAAGRFGQVVETLRPRSVPERAQAALAKAADSAEGLRLLGRSLVQLNRLAEARGCFRDLSRRGEASPRDHFELGRIYFLEGKCALAVEPLNRAWQDGEDDVSLHVTLAQALMCTGAVLGETSVQPLEGAAVGQLCEEGYVLAAAKEQGHFVIALPESAVYHVQAALRRDPNGLAVQILAGQVWLAAGHYEAAVECYARTEPRIAEANWSPAAMAPFYAEYAEALFGTDDVEGYLARLRQAFELDPARYGETLGAAYTRAAERYNQRGDLAGFVRCLEKAVAESPRNGELHYRLGNGYWESGRLREAAREYQLTLQIIPDHLDRERMLRLIARAAGGL